MVGDVMFDLALRHGARCQNSDGVLGTLTREHGILPGHYCLATIHRAESTDDPRRLRAIVDALTSFGRELPVVMPLHPRTGQTLARLGMLEQLAGGVLLIDPVGYRDMVQLEKYAALIATDSGGVQKEAFFHGVPCVTLRDETEWIELLERGWNRLADPTDAAAITSALRDALGTRGKAITPYGNGNAAQLIVGQLERDLD
jgi:UDP-GlcNAc3NAcA epimerase